MQRKGGVPLVLIWFLIFLSAFINISIPIQHQAPAKKMPIVLYYEASELDQLASLAYDAAYDDEFNFSKNLPDPYSGGKKTIGELVKKCANKTVIYPLPDKFKIIAKNKIWCKVPKGVYLKVYSDKHWEVVIRP